MEIITWPDAARPAQFSSNRREASVFPHIHYARTDNLI